MYMKRDVQKRDIYTKWDDNLIVSLQKRHNLSAVTHTRALYIYQTKRTLDSIKRTLNTIKRALQITEYRTPDKLDADTHKRAL